MKKLLIIYIILLFCVFKGYAQENSIDTTKAQTQAQEQTPAPVQKVIQSLTQAQKTNALALKYINYKAKQSPRNMHLLYQTAMAYLYTGQYAKASATFDEIVSSGAVLTHEILYFRGIAKENIGNLQDALWCFDEAIRLNGEKENPFYFSKRGYINYRLGAYPQAVIDLSRASLRMSDGVAEQWLKIARAKSKGDDNVSEPAPLDSAKQRYAVNDHILLYFDSLTNPQRADTAVYYKRAYAYFFIGRYDDAIKDFDRALQGGNKGRFAKPLRPNPDWYYFKALARISASMREHEDAMKHLDFAINNTKANPNYFHYWKKGEIHFNMAKYDLAIQELQKAHDLAPDDPDLKTLLERAKYMKNGGDVIEKARIKELIDNIHLAEFRKLEEGKKMYDEILNDPDLSYFGKEDLHKELRTKLLKDIYGIEPTLKELEEMRVALETTDWLYSPESWTWYHKVNESGPERFAGEIERKGFKYKYLVERDSIKKDAYDLRISKIEVINNRESTVNQVYRTIIFSTKSPQRDAITVKLYFGYMKNEYILTIDPACYLEVNYAKNMQSIQEKNYGNFERFAVVNPVVPKNNLLIKSPSAEFSSEEAMRKGVELLINAYENIILKQ